MGNCCQGQSDIFGKSADYNIYVVLTPELWPDYQTVDMVRHFLKKKPVSRLIIGCQLEVTTIYWRDCLSEVQSNRVEYVIDSLMTPDDYLLILNKARPILVSGQKKIHLLVPRNFDREAWRITAKAFFEHYAEGEWQIVYHNLPSSETSSILSSSGISSSLGSSGSFGSSIGIKLRTKSVREI